MTPAALAYIQIVLGAVLNIFAIYMLKKAKGFTVFMPSLVALVCICATQILLSRAMNSGLDMGFAVTLLIVAVMIGSTIMGIVLFKDALSVQKLIGLTIAIVGITVASLTRSP